MIRRVPLELACPGLARPVSFDFISDIHIRHAAGFEALRRATAAPGRDTLLLGGDYAEREEFIAPLFAHLAGRYRRVLAVWGNNDHRYRRAIEAAAGAAGIRLLCDEIVDLDGLALLGTADPADLRPSLPDIPHAPCLVLSHSPDILLTLEPSAPVVILAGHVHGGQIRFPGLPWWSHTAVGCRYGDGVARRGANLIFTGRGIGCSLAEIRNVPSEIYEVTLRPPADDGILAS